MHHSLSPLALSAGVSITSNWLSKARWHSAQFCRAAGWSGYLACHSPGGVYHAVILPLVLLEMGKIRRQPLGGGGRDMVARWSGDVAAAGINLANVIAPREKRSCRRYAGPATY